MLHNLKKAFGFSSSREDEDLTTDSHEVKDIKPSPFSQKNQNEASRVSKEDLESTVTEIFNHVVEQFNQALPAFLRNSVDPQKERQQLYSLLSDDVKKHLSNLEAAVTSQLEKTWRKERAKLQSDLQNVSKTAKDIEAKRAELKSRQLSADRQKRAMSERLHEMESRIMKIEAEKEQIELENKSMINKVKVVQIYEKKCEDLRAEITRLKNEINKARGASVSGAKNWPADSNAFLKETIATLEKTNSELNNKNLKLSKIDQDYRALIKKHKSLQEKCTKSDSLLAEKDSKIKKLQQELNQIKAEISHKDSQPAQINNKKTAENIVEAESKTKEKVFSRKHKDGYYGKTPDRNNSHEDDDILSGTDWIVQPSGSSARKDEPPKNRSRKRRNKSRDDGQMSLW